MAPTRPPRGLTVRLAAVAVFALVCVIRLGRCTPHTQTRSPSDQSSATRVCLVHDGVLVSDTSALSTLLPKVVDGVRAEVTALSLADSSSWPSFSMGADADGIQWLTLPRSSHKYDASKMVADSFRVLEWLREQPKFEHVVFHGPSTVAYYALIARDLAVDLQTTHFTLILLPQTTKQQPPGLSRREETIQPLEEAHMQVSVRDLRDASTTASCCRSPQLTLACSISCSHSKAPWA